MGSLRNATALRMSSCLSAMVVADSEETSSGKRDRECECPADARTDARDWGVHVTHSRPAIGCSPRRTLAQWTDSFRAFTLSHLLSS